MAKLPIEPGDFVRLQRFLTVYRVRMVLNGAAMVVDREGRAKQFRTVDLEVVNPRTVKDWPKSDNFPP